jgi:hypothetical protein
MFDQHFTLEWILGGTVVATGLNPTNVISTNTSLFNSTGLYDILLRVVWDGASFNYNNNVFASNIELISYDGMSVRVISTPEILLISLLGTGLMLRLRRRKNKTLK